MYYIRYWIGWSGSRTLAICQIPQTLRNTTAKTNSAVRLEIPQPVENYGP